MLREMALGVAVAVLLVGGSGTALAQDDNPSCDRRPFALDSLYVLIQPASTQQTGCWHKLPGFEEAIFQTDFTRHFETLARPDIDAHFKYFVGTNGTYLESALAAQSRDLVISTLPASKGASIQDRFISLHRTPVGSVCTNSNPSISDSDGLFGHRRFQAPTDTYSAYHARENDLIFSRGVFRDFHFDYAVRAYANGRAALCIWTDSFRDGNLKQYQFEDLSQAQLAAGGDGLIAAILQLIAGPLLAAERQLAETPARYQYSNLQSNNMWFSHSHAVATEIDFDFASTADGMQVVSLSNLEDRDRSKRYYLIRWSPSE